MKKLLLVLVLSMLIPIVSFAQVDRREINSIKVHFRQGASTLDENYMDNKATLTEFARVVKANYSDSTAHFRQIRVVASVSPEGGKAVNERIGKLRAEAIVNWISREIAANLDYSVEYMGIDWELLIELVEGRDDVPYRSEVLDILRNTPAVVTEGGKEVEKRYNALRALRGGAAYHWINKNLFPELRYSSARCEFWWETIPELYLGSAAERFAAEGGERSVPYTKSVDDDKRPVVTSNADWVTPLETTEGEISFTVAPNNSTEPRTTTLAVECYDKTHEIVVEQEGMEATLKLTSPSPVHYGHEGANDVITYEKSVDDGILPTVSCAEEWIEILEPTKEGVEYIVAPNEGEVERSATIIVESYGTQHEVAITQAAKECKPFFMAIKTNMLYDVAAVPNIGAEFYLGGNFSIAANYQHAWWSKDANQFYWRYYGADASIRWWFGKPTRIKPLQGHHIGVNYQILTYDFQLGNKGIMAGAPGGNLADRANHIVALEYGYSLPIGRRLNLDFGIGFGYHWGLFEEYMPIDGHHVWQATKRRQYFGPTKLEVSLVWLIGCGNYNKDKGGKR